MASNQTTVNPSWRDCRRALYNSSGGKVDFDGMSNYVGRRYKEYEQFHYRLNAATIKFNREGLQGILLDDFPDRIPCSGKPRGNISNRPIDMIEALPFGELMDSVYGSLGHLFETDELAVCDHARSTPRNTPSPISTCAGSVTDALSEKDSDLEDGELQESLPSEGSDKNMSDFDEVDDQRYEINDDGQSTGETSHVGSMEEVSSDEGDVSENSYRTGSESEDDSMGEDAQLGPGGDLLSLPEIRGAKIQEIIWGNREFMESKLETDRSDIHELFRGFGAEMREIYAKKGNFHVFEISLKVYPRKGKKAFADFDCEATVRLLFRFWHYLHPYLCRTIVSDFRNKRIRLYTWVLGYSGFHISSTNGSELHIPGTPRISASQVWLLPADPVPLSLYEKYQKWHLEGPVPYDLS